MNGGLHHNPLRTPEQGCGDKPYMPNIEGSKPWTRTDGIVLLDLFSGVGGFHLGLERAGFNIRKSFFSEIEKHPVNIYRRQFPNSTYVGSVTDFQQWERLPEWERPNIITFGSPCQDFSLAGKRRGIEGERSGLIQTAIDIVTQWRPDFFIWENVKGVFSSNDGADFWAVVKAFADIGGYRLEWQLLNTAWVLPQSRERVYLVGCLGNRCRGGVFPVRADDFGAAQRAEPTSVVNTISAGGHSGEMHSSMTLIETIQGGEISNRLRLNSSQDGIVFNEDDKSQALSAGHGNMPKIAITTNTLETQPTHGVVCIGNLKGDIGHNVHNVYSSDGIASTVMLNHGSVQNILDKKTTTRIRRLTEIECERLQGFPDDWTAQAINDTGKEYRVPKTARYKAMGNAVTVDIVALVGRAILRADKC